MDKHTEEWRAIERALENKPDLWVFFQQTFVEPSNRARFLDEVDESSFSLQQWVEALNRLVCWLDQRELRLKLEDQIGYVSCAAESASVGPGFSDLPELLDEMLETYGCDRAESRGPRDSGGAST